MGKRRSSSTDGDLRERLTRFVTLLGVVGLVLLGVLVWQWIAALSTDALALAGGVVIGMVAVLVPLALIGLGAWITLRVAQERRAVQPQTQQPPVVIVSGGQMYPGIPGAWQPEQYPPMLADGGNGNGRKAPRSFSVIGDE